MSPQSVLLSCLRGGSSRQGRVCLSVRPSVCLSVTLPTRLNGKATRGVQFSFHCVSVAIRTYQPLGVKTVCVCVCVRVCMYVRFILNAFFDTGKRWKTKNLSASVPRERVVGGANVSLLHICTLILHTVTVGLLSVHSLLCWDVKLKRLVSYINTLC